MLEMALEFDKFLKCVGNDVYIWELAKVCEKRLKYVGNDVDLWEKCSNMWRNDLIIWQTA